jgi:hypothetical protein
MMSITAFLIELRSNQHYPVELSAVMEMFYIWAITVTSSHMAIQVQLKLNLNSMPQLH